MSKDTFESPLESVFEITPGTTLLPHKNKRSDFVDTETGEITKIEEEPEITVGGGITESELEGEAIAQINDVYTKAMEVYDDQAEMIQIIDPKFAARTAEVANQYLSTALTAIKLKTDILNQKRKMKNGKNQVVENNTTNNNLIVGDRNDILRSILNQEQD